ncbi:hypothetical protein WDZ92_20285 [Nostoc sp. NIES-2111]
MTKPSTIETLGQAADTRARLLAERDEILDRKRDLLDDKEQHVLAAAIGDRASSAALAEIAAEEKALDDRLGTLKAGLAELDRIEAPLRAADLAEHRKREIFEAYQLAQELVATSAKFDEALADAGKHFAARKDLADRLRRLAVHENSVLGYLDNPNAIHWAMAASPLGPQFPLMFFGPTVMTLADADRQNVRLPGPVEREIQKGQH